MEKFKFFGDEGDITIYTYDIGGEPVDLYAVNTREEAASVCEKLNAAVSKLMGED